MDPEAPQPTLTRTHSGRGWRLPLAVIVVAVIALVGLTRLGSTDPAANVTPTLGAVLPNPFVPPQAPTLPPVIHEPGVMPRSSDGLTYADGIPTSIAAQPVHRVTEALAVPVGRELLVGGWYRLPYCQAPRRIVVCAASTLSDVPLVQGQGDVRTSFIALDSNLADVGPHVVLAVVEKDPRCSIFASGGDCQPRLRVLEEVWSGAG